MDRKQLLTDVYTEIARLGWSDDDALLLCGADGVIPEVASFDQLTDEQLEEMAEHLGGAEPSDDDSDDVYYHDESGIED